MNIPIIIIITIVSLLSAFFSYFVLVTTYDKKDDTLVSRTSKSDGKIDEEFITNFYKAYGGVENIKEVLIKGNRLSVEVFKLDLVETDSIQNLGASGIFVSGNKIKGNFSENSYVIYEKINK